MVEKAKEIEQKKINGLKKLVKTSSNGLVRMPGKTFHLVKKDEAWFKNFFVKTRLLLYRCQH